MILFIAPNPHKVKKHEGFLQRVLAIDNLLKDHEKLYSDDFDDETLAGLLIKADLIYVHSMYNAEKIIECYQWLAEKIITDLHGIVPEEEEYADNQEGFRVMRDVEELAFKYGKYFVAVTDTMKRHFTLKYPRVKNAAWVVLPIHGEYCEQLDLTKKRFNEVIYAGGGQPWQNVPKMVDAINGMEKFNFVVLTHDIEAFNSLDESAAERVKVKSVKADQVAQYYKTASLGFILRDDSPVNNVACPTKMIEYLACGVVPVVLSENIGDFKELGYEYVTIDNLTKTTPSEEFLKNAQMRNRQVYERLLKNTASGKTRLLKVAGLASAGRISNTISPEVVASGFTIQKLRNRATRQDYQIEVYKRMVGEYAELVQKLSKDLEKRPEYDVTKRIRTLQAILRRK